MRNYKRKPGRVNPDRRMTRAAELRAQGLSLRQIAERLACSYQTVANDLARWQRERPNVAPLVSNSPVKNTPPGGTNLTPEFDSGSNVIKLRRRS